MTLFLSKAGRIAALAGLAFVALTSGCASSDESATNAGCILCGFEGGPLDSSADRSLGDVISPDGGPNRNPLCGVFCDPDWTGACVQTSPLDDAGGGDANLDGANGDTDGPDALDSASTDRDAEGGAETSDEASVSEDANTDGTADASDANLLDQTNADVRAPGDATLVDVALAVDAPQDALAHPGASSDAAGNGMACHVGWINDDSPVGSCEPAGEKGAGVSCTNASDCLPGMTCVEGGPSGPECRPYCCGDPESCPHATYCSTRTPHIGSVKISHVVPVCVPATPCKLLAGALSGCTGSQICTIVRADGTTACDEAGAGTRGEPCPCADGFVCGKAANQCLKVCRIQESATDCPKGTCQAGSSTFPTGFGVCIGGAADAAADAQGG